MKKNKMINKYILGAMIFAPGVTMIDNANTSIALADASTDLQAAETAVATAQAGPTIETIEAARDLVNKLPEGSDKNRLQGVLNNIYDINGYELERNSASANVDIYIKCENMISLSLSRNSITFEDYSGVQPLEMEDAVVLSVKSSLNYDVNAYLPTEIKGSEFGDTMNNEVLEIKASESTEGYKKFTKVGVDDDSKVVLLSNQTATLWDSPNAEHSIDLNLDSDTAHTKDVYKATIKFEVSQN